MPSVNTAFRLPDTILAELQSELDRKNATREPWERPLTLSDVLREMVVVGLRAKGKKEAA